MRFIPLRSFHSSIFRLARGTRRPPPSATPPPVERLDENEQIPVQEQFARLELQRLGKQEFHEDLQPETAEEETPTRPYVNPSGTSVILFPGQGTQFVGMG